MPTKVTLPVEFAEDVKAYWQSSKVGADTWLERAKQQIHAIGGRILSEVYGSDVTGKAAYLLAFELGEDKYKVVWPVLPARGGNAHAARVQAATMLFHDVKGRCVAAKVMGVRGAFLPFLLLPNGQTAGEASSQGLLDMFPQLPSLSSGKGGV
jgi:hypothetical protein